MKVDRRLARERFFRERESAARRQAMHGQGSLLGRELGVYMPHFHRSRATLFYAKEPR